MATKDQFFASMSQEMQTPLLSVLSYLDLVLQSESTLDAEQRDFLESAQSSGKLLRATLDSVLELVKASSPSVEPRLLSLGESRVEDMKRLDVSSIMHTAWRSLVTRTAG